jgi:hypothetical protein
VSASHVESEPGTAAETLATVRLRRYAWAAWAAHVLLLAMVGWQNLHLLNTDAVAYLRIAHYYSTGAFDLAVSGYWGPLLSWLIALGLGMGLEPLAAGRIAMGLSALVFLWGAQVAFRAFCLPRLSATVGLWLAAMASVAWSAEVISPDLLLSGLVVLAASRMLGAEWRERPLGAFTAGLLWGVAYLTKAVALPLGFTMSVAVALLSVASRAAPWRPVARQVAWMWLGLALVAAPWIGILSLKYGRPTFSTTAAIAHAIAGPQDQDRYHPFARALHTPEAGRITAWEDPSRMPYRYWSPWASVAALRHQAWLMVTNVGTLAWLLARFDVLGLGAASLVACAWLRRSWRVRLAADRWRWGGVFAVLVAAMYLPVAVHLADQRYLFPAFPLLLVACLGATAWLTRGLRTEVAPAAVLVLIVISFAAASLPRVQRACAGFFDPASMIAHDLARRLGSVGIRGPVAGSGLVLGGRTGLYLAFLMDRPWLGDNPQATVEDYRGSGAELVVVGRRQPVREHLDRDLAFKDLDPGLFENVEDADRFPVKVYQVRR